MSFAHLDPNDPSVSEAIRDVMDPKTATNWVLFGYVPKTARLKVVETGEGDVSEITELVSDGKLMFAYLRKEMSETWKFVLIAWCGDGVPANRKGFFPTHKEEMEAFLRKNNFNYSAMISAREEADLEEAEIVKALNKTSTFIRARTAKDKPTEKLDDVRNRYWTKERKEETSRQEEMAARKKAKEAEAQASLESERVRMQRQAESVLQQREMEREQAAERFREEDRVRTQKQSAYFQSQHERVMGMDAQRSAPAADAGASRGTGAAPVSRGKAAARFMAACQQQSEPAPRPAPARRAAPAPVRQPEPEPEPEPAPEQSSWGATETYEEQPAEQPAEQSSWGATETYEEQPAEQPAEQSSWGATETYEEQPAEQPAETYEEQPAETYEQPAETYEEQPAETYEQPAETYEEQPATGLGQARAVYDYEAQQEGDLAFKEGDIINLIDTSDPSGWWVGELNGYQGNFPSNFVEMC